MLNITSLLEEQLKDYIINFLGIQIKEDNQDKVRFAINCVTHTLVWKIAKVTENFKKGTKLAAALERDHNGIILTDPIAYWVGEIIPANSRMLDSGGIIRHNLGASKEKTIQVLIDWTKLEQTQIEKLLQLLAPFVMGALGFIKTDEGLDAQQLAAALQAEIQSNILFTYIGDCLEKDEAIDGKTLGQLFKNKRSQPPTAERSPKSFDPFPNELEQLINAENEDFEKFIDEPQPGVQKVYTGFSDKTTPLEELSPNRTLQTKHSYYFWLEVSNEVIKNAIDEVAVALPMDFIPDATQLNVAIFTLANHFVIDPNADVGELRIDENKEASVLKQALTILPIEITEEAAKKRLFFPVETIARTGAYHLLCHIYYENILVQSRQVSAQVTNLPETMDEALLTELDYTITQTLSADDLKKHKKHRLSVLLKESDNSHSFQFFGGRQFKNASNFDNHEIEHHINRVRGGLRMVAWGDSNKWEGQAYRYDGHLSEAAFTRDLAILATRGYQFYDAIIDKLSNGMFQELKKAMQEPGYVQVALQRGARTVLPLALLYDHPLRGNLGTDEFKLCSVFSNAVHHDLAIEKTVCFQSSCPHTHEKDVICPSGFWGFRHYLGMPHTSNQTTTAPSEIFYQDHPEFMMSVSTDPAFVLRTGHEANLGKFIEFDWVTYADTLQETLDAFKDENTPPNIVYFYCHGGLTQTNNPAILVGNDETILRSDIRAEGIQLNKSHPLVFINGCHTTALHPAQALEFVSAFVEVAQAAGVIGTEITIFEPLATAFAEAFFKRFLNGEPVGKAIRNSRLDLLRRGNPLGLVYIPYVISSLRLLKEE